MERIQIAIAKARAARAERLAQGLGQDAAPPEAPPAEPPAAVAAPPAMPAAAPVPAAAPPPAPALAAPEAPAGADPAEIDRAWRALPEMKLRAGLLARNRIVAVSGGPGAAEVDGIRTRLLHHIQSRGWRRVAITSPGPGCGKTTVAVNLGFSLGRQREQRALVMELDLRRPSMARALGLSERHSMAQVLEGDAAFADNAVRFGPNLAFATSHSAVRQSAELLQSRRTAAALAAIEAAYAPTVTLFDLPPMLASDDALAFMGRVDGALLVAAAEVTTAKEIDRCERELASRTGVIGVILNRCRYMERSDAYGTYGDYG
jgi:Mrp family chromosome partitioning ATPase